MNDEGFHTLDARRGRRILVLRSHFGSSPISVGPWGVLWGWAIRSHIGSNLICAQAFVTRSNHLNLLRTISSLIVSIQSQRYLTAVSVVLKICTAGTCRTHLRSSMSVLESVAVHHSMDNRGIRAMSVLRIWHQAGAISGTLRLRLQVMPMEGSLPHLHTVSP